MGMTMHMRPVVAALAAAGALLTTTTGAASVPTELHWSCWADVTTGASLCVQEGEDLVQAVADEAGVTLIVPEDAVINGESHTAPARRSAAPTAEALAASTVVSIIYDDINYGGGSFVLSSSNGSCATGWTYGYSSLRAIGWNDRASSFRSYAGCQTILYENDNYSGNSIGYQSSASSLGGMNDRASSWRAS